jgi:hypothetical protein
MCGTTLSIFNACLFIYQGKKGQNSISNVSNHCFNGVCCYNASEKVHMAGQVVHYPNTAGRLTAITVKYGVVERMERAAGGDLTMNSAQ